MGRKFRYERIEMVARAAELARQYTVSMYPMMAQAPMHWRQTRLGAFETNIDASFLNLTDRALERISSMYSRKAHEILGAEKKEAGRQG